MIKKVAHNSLIDFARILGALAVVAIHVTDGLIILPNHFGGISWWWANIINSLSRIAVPLFIMISGYLLLDPEKNIDTKNFISVRLKRVFIPLFFWSAFYFLWRFIFWKDIFTPGDIVYSFFSLSLFHLYFLLLIAGLYILTPKIRELIKNYSQRQLLKLIITSFFISFLVTTFIYLVPEWKLIKNIFTMPFIFLGYYLFGIYVKNIRLNNLSFIFFTILYISFGIVTAILLYLNTKYKFFWVDNFGQYFHEPFSPLIIFMSVISFSLIMNSDGIVKKINSRILKQIAATTLGIYLIHPFLIDVVNTYFRFDIHHISSALWLYITFKIFLIFFVSYIAVFVYQKGLSVIKSKR